jgi:hypothetical protein
MLQMFGVSEHAAIAEMPCKSEFYSNAGAQPWHRRASRTPDLGHQLPVILWSRPALTPGFATGWNGADPFPLR